ncbi:hypothetical protein HPB48_020299 [Haemaphysalis longicornis]|uniref:C2 domain-containing protein n=1 Tax=Haemaphysalis longicornis TaxID=44386 RepID=A0A9J6GY36_HAELO|nr:hypothetical protein HPB48_020299 [Haemaphysalis longicornis]
MLTSCPLSGSIQPDLYRKKEAVFFQSREASASSASATAAVPTHAGRLHFRLKYDFDKSDLVVHVIEAMDLGGPGSQRQLDPVGPSGVGFGEPCVRVVLLPEVDSKQRQALMRRRSTDPLFDETFKFPVSFDDLPARTLLFQARGLDFVPAQFCPHIFRRCHQSLERQGRSWRLGSPLHRGFQ